MCFAFTAAAQSVTGRVVNESNSPLELVNAVLLCETDSTFAAGTITQADGSFSIELPDASSYILRLSLIGYVSQFISVSSAGDIGTVTLSAGSVTLDEVAVKAERPVITLKNNALITTVEGTSLSHAGTANDVLPYIPMVLGSNGNFTVFGKGSPLIYVNNRKIADTTELDLINSADIKSVEVITNPGAKYDAAAKSVIRIITKRPDGEGFSGTLRTSDGWQNSGFGTSDFANLKYRTKGLEVYAMLSYYNNETKMHIDNNIETHASSIMNQNIHKYSALHLNQPYGRAGFSYLFNDNHSIGAYYSYRCNKRRYNETNESEIIIDDVLTDELHMDGYARFRTAPHHYAAAYYDGKIRKLAILLEASYNMERERGWETYDEYGTTSGYTRTNAYLRCRNRLIAQKLLLSYPLWKGNIEAGDEFSSSRAANLYTTNSTMVLSSDTRVDEKHIAGFAELTQTFCNFSLAAGLRYEHVQFKYIENGYDNPNQNKTYNNFFPTLSVSGNINNLQLGLNYAYKTRRPDYSLLSGAVDYVNRFLLGSGNPYLKQEKIQTADLTAAWKWLFAQLSYTYRDNAILSVVKPYDETAEVKLMTIDNMPGFSRLTFFFGTHFFFGAWQPRWNIGVNKQWLKIEYGNGKKSMNSPVVYAQWQNAIHLPADIWLNVDMQYTTKGDGDNWHTSSSWFVNCKLYKAFFDNRFSINIKADDIFNTGASDYTLYSKDVINAQLTHTNHRVFMLTLQYTFNTSNDRYKGKGAGNSELQRF